MRLRKHKGAKIGDDGHETWEMSASRLFLVGSWLKIKDVIDNRVRYPRFGSCLRNFVLKDWQWRTFAGHGQSEL